MAVPSASQFLKRDSASSPGNRAQGRKVLEGIEGCPTAHTLQDGFVK